MTDAAKVLIEVQAGVIPGQPEPEYTRRWAITSAEWERAEQDDKEADEGHRFACFLLLSFRAAEADEYARMLRDPSRFNWTRTEWIWL
jgi:hypothetical protein